MEQHFLIHPGLACLTGMAWKQLLLFGYHDAPTLSPTLQLQLGWLCSAGIWQTHLLLLTTLPCLPPLPQWRSSSFFSPFHHLLKSYTINPVSPATLPLESPCTVVCVVHCTTANNVHHQLPEYGRRLGELNLSVRCNFFNLHNSYFHNWKPCFLEKAWPLLQILCVGRNGTCNVSGGLCLFIDEELGQ